MAGDGSGLPGCKPHFWSVTGQCIREVLRSGDVIPGLGTVLDLLIWNEAINDSGQVAIWVRDDDGSGVDK